MKIIFLQDYEGRETAMRRFSVGDIAETPTAQALELIKLGVAEETVTETKIETLAAIEDVSDVVQKKPRKKAIK